MATTTITWNDGTGNWTTDTTKWTPTGPPVATSDVVIGSTSNGNVTLDHPAANTINSLTINTSNVLSITGATALTVTTTGTNSGTVGLAGTAALTVTSGFTNSGALDLDTSAFGDGGGSLTVGGTLANTGSVQIGPSNGTLTAATTVTLGGLNNAAAGTIDVFGSAAQ